MRGNPPCAPPPRHARRPFVHVTAGLPSPRGLTGAVVPAGPRTQRARESPVAAGPRRPLHTTPTPPPPAGGARPHTPPPAAALRLPRNPAASRNSPPRRRRGRKRAAPLRVSSRRRGWGGGRGGARPPPHRRRVETQEPRPRGSRGSLGRDGEEGVPRGAGPGEARMSRGDGARLGSSGRVAGGRGGRGPAGRCAGSRPRWLRGGRSHPPPTRPRRTGTPRALPAQRRGPPAEGRVEGGGGGRNGTKPPGRGRRCHLTSNMSPSRKIMAMQDTMSAWFCTMNSWLSTGGFLLLFLRIAMAGRELGAAAASPLPAQLLSPRPGRGGGGGGGGGRAAQEWQPPLRFTPPRPQRSSPGRRQQRPCRPAGRLPPHGGGEGQRPAVQTDRGRCGPASVSRAEPSRAVPLRPATGWG